ncbi:hypothetical protein CAPTEDRAFT_186131 [Capitella teleta]|uniref:Uncharacterized protein n=1 Tax=Capitella teleta TaxID=283909 RepID=R7VDB3_CAPTE|nr:hypothetical protein CAPTEDRAFT_186131 [Capitella teleta]|eukprot:ELU16823.1 hypothetical protein CAPTEDRAFT_186131 [Capitella teleta]
MATVAAMGSEVKRRSTSDLVTVTTHSGEAKVSKTKGKSRESRRIESLTQLNRRLESENRRWKEEIARLQAEANALTQAFDNHRRSGKCVLANTPSFQAIKLEPGLKNNFPIDVCSGMLSSLRKGSALKQVLQRGSRPPDPMPPPSTKPSQVVFSAGPLSQSLQQTNMICSQAMSCLPGNQPEGNQVIQPTKTILPMEQMVSTYLDDDCLDKSTVDIQPL